MVAPDDVDARHRALANTLAGRFWLRFHMSLMLAVAFSAGALGNRLLLEWPVHHAVLRWLFALAAAYGAFFIAMRLWLAYVGARPFMGIDLGNALDSSGTSAGGGGGGGIDASSSVSKGIGGGRFGGGGATSSFDSAAPRPSVGATSNVSSSRGGFGIDIGGDDGEFIVLLLVTLAVTAALVGGAAYLLVAAPHLLPDVAFGAAITHGFGRGVHQASRDPGWTGSVLAATWKPFAAVTVTIVIAGLVFEHSFPGARTLGEAWRLFF